MDIQHEFTMLKAAGSHTHLVEYLRIIEDPIGLCLLFEWCLSNNLNTLLSNRKAITEEETLYFSAQIATGTTYPTKLDKPLEKGECKLKPDAKGLVRLVLDFDSKNRPQLTSLRRQKSFKLGYCPTVLSEDVFKGKPDLTTDGKRKAIPSESEQKVYTKTN